MSGWTAKCAGFLAAFGAMLIAGCEQQPSEAPPAPADIQAPSNGAGAVPIGKNFDFYVLSLSWSPSYCEAEGSDADRQQCAAGRPYGFVVHGLWPQFERGFPRDCATGDPGVPRERLRELYDIMPAGGLIRYQWRTHGTCTGLSQENYFTVLRAARERVTIPTEFARLETYRTLDPAAAESAFLKANSDMPKNGIAVVCDRRYLRELRICMTRDLQFRSCPAIDRRACRLDRVVMPPLRGG
jgi:ribonuclease T2